MQTESWVGRNLASEALAAEGAMEQLTRQGPSCGVDFELKHPVLMAIALSLPFWIALTVLLWKLFR